jgi:hypothetical protein
LITAWRSATDRKTSRFSALCEGIEEALDGVEPGSRGRREVESQARIAFNPLPHGGTHVGCVFVEDGVDGRADGDFSLDGIEERMNS